MAKKNIIHRRKFLLQIGAVGTAGSGLLSPSSAAPRSSSRTIKLATEPRRKPFLLDETFGPADAKGADIHKWLTVLRFEVVKHVDAKGNDARVENMTSDRFEGEIAITASVHLASSIKETNHPRLEALDPDEHRKNIWTQQLNGGNGKPLIYTYDSNPLRTSSPIGFKWVTEFDDKGRIALSFSDITKEAQELPIDENTRPAAVGFQLGLALDPAPEPSNATVVSVSAHAGSYGAWTPTEDIRAVETYYNGKTPNFKHRRTADIAKVGMGTNRGFIGIGYMVTR